ncbi:hypothetical protein PV416_31020 [Streptomyces ipomoeae]|nr:hypothetical protein [Streptomyces ipomoeae]MDX2698641.1 hypothetical protein [Streptomyces ipomoeae]MDX2825391.1 hypothetical protein [Streptomyces ipomoeae]MDX2844300.1 hypothetical protein [Streptomyces ipomoeae]MDX2878681.1 hypothetical protein [Streptomyces ipomoeae]MDX2932992.1 hypothetical protein [Streptomyces ipomoeae]
MTTDTSRPRPLRNVTATATATGSALAVALLPLVVGALAARSVGGDPMASVNALISGGGQRAKLSRTQLRGCGRRALATAQGAWGQSRSAWGQSTRWARRKPAGTVTAGSGSDRRPKP